MPNCTDLLRQALDALNTAPRFRFGDSDSYKLAARIDRYLAANRERPANLAEPTNADRARRVEQILDAYARLLGGDREDTCIVIDLLADLCHYADREGFDFQQCLRLALQHHAAETAAPPLALVPSS